jgi:hypothetical protein
MNAPVPGFALQDGNILQNILGGDGFNAAAPTAHAGGGQAAATPIPVSAMIVSLSVVASVNDSYVLPFALAGQLIFVFNPTGNSANIYGQVAKNQSVSPAAIDTINGTAGSTPYALAGGARAIFFCGSNGAWAALTG